MNLHEKLKKLKRLNDLVLYKWTAGSHRIAENFILLSDLRLNVLTCSEGSIVFSSAAPILYMDKGRPVIQFRDRDVMTILNGQRRGVNVAGCLLKAGESATEARYCESRIVDEDHCPKWLEDKVMSLGNSPTYPVAQLRLPELFRISKKPETLKPIFTTALIRDIGGERLDSTETLLQKFRNNLDLFGYYTDEGFVISNDYIASGGCVVSASKGITARSGSVVHMMTLGAFRNECEKRHWKIRTVEDLKNDMARETDSAESR